MENCVILHHNMVKEKAKSVVCVGPRKCQILKIFLEYLIPNFNEFVLKKNVLISFN